MNVGELKKFLEHFHDDIEVVNKRYSDMQIIQPQDFSIVGGVEKDGWVMRSHETMSVANKLAEKKYLHLEGN